MSAIRTGDYVVWEQPKFEGGSFYRGRVSGRPRFVGTERYSGKVLKHSYGEKTGQHTFTVLLDGGGKKLVKGRNLYPNLVQHVIDENSKDRVLDRV